MTSPGEDEATALAEGGLDAVLDYVRDLERAPAFKALSLDEQRNIAERTKKVLAFMLDPTAGQPHLAETARALADDKKKDDAAEKLKGRLAGKTKLVGEDFKGGAAREGAQDFKALVEAVDFPKFVAGLINGVYTSIVQSSIQQMREYGKLLEGVVKSVNEFAKENITLGQARDFLVDKFPQALRVDNGPDGPRVMMNQDLDDKDKPDFGAFFGTKQSFDLEDEGGQKALVENAQLKLARMKQQQLSTMVLLGINRIVVTEGEIKASVTFDVKSTDVARRSDQASMSDVQAEVNTRSGGGWFSDDWSHVDTRVSTANASSTQASDARLDAHAKLTGYVQVKFKSETFPLERLATGDEIATVQQRAQK
jgi:hypothetical protein